MAAEGTHATTEELFETVLSVRSVPRQYNEDQLPLSVNLSREVGEESRGSLQADRQLRVAVAGAGDSSGTQRKGNVRRWKPLPSNAVKTVTEITSLCVIVICKI
jgi:hypothetical protein